MTTGVDELGIDIKIVEGYSNDSSPLAVLGLSVRVFNSLMRSGLTTIKSLVFFIQHNSLYDIRNVGSISIDELGEKLNEYFASKPDMIMKSKNAAITKTIAPETREPGLSKSLELLKLVDRDWQVLKMRSKGKTLEEIGIENGITRERSRQILRKAYARFENNFLWFVKHLETLTQKYSELWIPFTDLSLEGASKIITNTYNLNMDTHINYADGEKILSLLRLSVYMPNPILLRSFPRLTFLACSLTPQISTHPNVIKALVDIKEKNRKWSYKELAIKILHDEGKPLHWREISHRAEKIGRKNEFYATAIYNVLQGKSDLFVRVGQGTYGLAEWGLSKAENYNDIVAGLMKMEKTALSFSTILKDVNSKRKISKGSLQMFLDMNVRFYRSQSNLFGLRAWLAPREKQNLLTPSWQVEDEKSYERVAKAREKGIDVEGVISWDLQEHDDFENQIPSHRRKDYQDFTKDLFGLFESEES